MLTICQTPGGPGRCLCVFVFDAVGTFPHVLFLQQNSPWYPGEEQPVTHGSYFYYAWKEGLLAPNNANIVSLHTVSTLHLN